MRSIMIVVGMMILVVAVALNAQAPAPKPGPEHQKMYVWLGDWTWDEEARDSPSGPWYRTPGSMQVRLMQGGFFIEFRWKSNIKGQEVSGVEIEGYDPIKKVNLTSFFASNGARGGVTSAVYKGNVEEVSYAEMSADGKKIEARCTWNFAADALSVSGSCEQLTDGKWWPFRRSKGTKVKAISKNE